MGTPPPIEIANVSMGDTLLIMVIALVVLGPRRLPLIGRQIGKLMYEFRKASNDFKFQMEEELRNSEEADRRKKEEAERERALAAAPPPPQLEQATTPAAEIAAVALDSDASAPSLTDSLHSSEITDSDLAAESAPSSETHPSDAEAPAAPATDADPAPPPAADEFSLPIVAESTPRILPPSTGEKVAAERPGAQPRQQELFGPTPDDPGNAPETANSEAERSEPAAHHG
jgi:sec-independent protein translocase protein TatB